MRLQQNILYTKQMFKRKNIMSKRYTHWFWNSNFAKWVARKTGKFSSWLWYMQYGRNKAKKST